MNSPHSDNFFPLSLSSDEIKGSALALSSSSSSLQTPHPIRVIHDPYEWLCRAADYLNPHRFPFHHVTAQQVHELSQQLPPPPFVLTRQWLEMVWREGGEPALLYLIRCFAFHYVITMLAPTLLLGREEDRMFHEQDGSTAYCLCWEQWPSSALAPPPPPSPPALLPFSSQWECERPRNHFSTPNFLPLPSSAKCIQNEAGLAIRCGIFRVVGLYLTSKSPSLVMGSGRTGGDGSGGGSGYFLTEYVQTGWETFSCLSCLFYPKEVQKRGHPSGAFRPFLDLPAHLGGSKCEHCGKYLPRYPTWSLRAHVVLMEEGSSLYGGRRGAEYEPSSFLFFGGGSGSETRTTHHRSSCSAVVLGEANIATLRLGAIVRCIYFERQASPSSGGGDTTSSASRSLAIHSVETIYAHRLSSRNSSSCSSHVGAGSSLHEGSEENSINTRNACRSSSPASLPTCTFPSSSSLSSSAPSPPLWTSFTLDKACSVFAPRVLGNHTAKQALLLCALHTMYVLHPLSRRHSSESLIMARERGMKSQAGLQPSMREWSPISTYHRTPTSRLVLSREPGPLHAVLIGAGKSGKSSLLQAMSRLWESDGSRDATYLSPTVVRGGLDALWPHRSGQVWCGGAALLSPAIQVDEGVTGSASKPSVTLLLLRSLLEYGEVPGSAPFFSSRSFPFRPRHCVPALFDASSSRSCSGSSNHSFSRHGDDWYTGNKDRGCAHARIVLGIAKSGYESPPFFSNAQLTMGMEEEVLTLHAPNSSSFSGLLPSFRLFIPLESGLSLSHSMAVSERVRSEASVRRTSSSPSSSSSRSPRVHLTSSPLNNSRMNPTNLPDLSPRVLPPISSPHCRSPSQTHVFSFPLSLGDPGVETLNGDSPNVSLPWDLTDDPRRLISRSPSIQYEVGGIPSHLNHIYTNGFLGRGDPVRNGSPNWNAYLKGWLRSLRGECTSASVLGPCKVKGGDECSAFCSPPDYETIERALERANALPFFYDRLIEHLWLVQQATAATRSGTMPCTTNCGGDMTSRRGRTAGSLALPPPACLRGNVVQGTSSARQTNNADAMIPASQCLSLQRHLETLYSLSVSRLLLPDAMRLSNDLPHVPDPGEVHSYPFPAGGAFSLAFTLEMAEEVWNIYYFSLRTAARCARNNPSASMEDGDHGGVTGRLGQWANAGGDGGINCCIGSLPPSSLLPTGIIGGKRTRGGRPAKKVLCMQFIQGLSQLQKMGNHREGGKDGRGSIASRDGVCKMEMVKRLYEQMGGMEVFRDTVDGFVSQLQEMGMMIKRPGGWMVRAG